MTLKEALQAKGDAVKAYRDILDRAEKESRPLTAEEQQQLDRCEATIDEANAVVESEQKAAKRREFLTNQEASLRTPVLPGNLQRAGSDGANTQIDRRSGLERYRDMVESGMSRKDAIAAVASERDERATARNAAMRQFLLTGSIDYGLRERAALQLDNDATGGFLRMAEQFVARLIQDLDRVVLFRQLATVFMLADAESLGVPTLDTDISDTAWTTELAIGTEDTSMMFGKRRLTPHPLAKYIKVSKDMLRSTAMSAEAIVRERMSYKFGTVQETAFMTGTGSGQPLGVFTASNAGISTSRDVSTSNTTTAITADGLIECKYSMESQWLSSASLRWIFHRTAVKNIRKLKDGDGQYLWRPGLSSDTGDTILDIPVLTSEYAPSTFTSQQYVGILGDFAYYWIADSFSMEIQRLVELGALTNQDYFIGRAKLDGMPVLEKAFARVKLA